jgi:6-phospho-3-hexuloisomerase
MKTIITELNKLHELFDNSQVEKIIESLCKTKSTSIIGLGAGRMGYSMRAFIMRLGHLGYEACMYGDTCVPAVDENTLILVNSSSGETKSIVRLCEIAKNVGAKIISFTCNDCSTIGQMSFQHILIPKINSLQPMKSIYEQFTLLLFDEIARKIIDKRGINIETTHTNLE